MYKFKLFPQFGRLIRCAVLGAKKARGFDPSKQQLPELQTEVPTLSFEIFQRDNRNNGSPDISE